MYFYCKMSTKIQLESVILMFGGKVLYGYNVYLKLYKNPGHVCREGRVTDMVLMQDLTLPEDNVYLKLYLFIHGRLQVHAKLLVYPEAQHALTDSAVIEGDSTLQSMLWIQTHSI